MDENVSIYVAKYLKHFTNTQFQSRHNKMPFYSSFIVTFISMLCILYKKLKTIVDENERKAGRQKLKVPIISVAPAVRRVKGQGSLINALLPLSAPEMCPILLNRPLLFYYIITSKIKNENMYNKTECVNIR